MCYNYVKKITIDWLNELFHFLQWINDNLLFYIHSVTTNGLIIFQGRLVLGIETIKQHNYQFAFKFAVCTKVLQCTKFEYIPYSTMMPGIKYVNRLLSIPKNAVAPGGNLIMYIMSCIW